MSYLINPADFIMAAVLTVSSVTDILKNRIYNKVLLAGFLGILMSHLIYGVSVGGGAVLYLLLFMLLFILLFFLGLSGGGDAKLYMLLAFARPDFTGLFAAVSSVLLAGLAVGLGQLIRGRMPERLKNIAWLLTGSGGMGRRERVLCLTGRFGTTPLAPFVLVAFLAAVLVERSGLWTG